MYQNPRYMANWYISKKFYIYRPYSGHSEHSRKNLILGCFWHANHRWKKQVPKTAQNDVFLWVLRVAGIWPIYVKLFRDIPIGHISWVLIHIWHLNILTIFYGNFDMLHSQILGKNALKCIFKAIWGVFHQNFAMEHVKISIKYCEYV